MDLLVGGHYSVPHGWILLNSVLIISLELGPESFLLEDWKVCLVLGQQGPSRQPEHPVFLPVLTGNFQGTTVLWGEVSTLRLLGMEQTLVSIISFRVNSSTWRWKASGKMQKQSLKRRLGAGHWQDIGREPSAHFSEPLGEERPFYLPALCTMPGLHDQQGEDTVFIKSTAGKIIQEPLWFRAGLQGNTSPFTTK